MFGGMWFEGEVCRVWKNARGEWHVRRLRGRMCMELSVTGRGRIRVRRGVHGEERSICVAGETFNLCPSLHHLTTGVAVVVKIVHCFPHVKVV